jgi:hypothetical protein
MKKGQKMIGYEPPPHIESQLKIKGILFTKIDSKAFYSEDLSLTINCTEAEGKQWKRYYGKAEAGKEN